jgi:nucleoside-diphosphate-sugar epimerase
MLDAFTISCHTLDQSGEVTPSPVMGPSDEHNGSQILFQNPRTLGRGVDNFDEVGVPQTPYMGSSRTEHPRPHGNPLLDTPQVGLVPNSANIDASLQKMTLEDSCYTIANGSIADVGSASLTSTSSLTFSSQAGALNHRTNNQLVLVRGGASFSGAHITMRLLAGGYNVRILARDCLTSTSELSELVKARMPPQAHNRLLIFKGTDLTEALEGCDFVVCNSEPETGDLTESSDISKRFLEDMQDLFLSIHQLCRRSTVNNPHHHHNHSIEHHQPQPATRPPRIVWISTAATLFPVTTASQLRSRYLIEAKALALREAERIAKKADIPLVVLLPSVMVGTALTDAKSEASRLLSQLATGGHRWFPFAPSFAWNFVDVQDVAEATCEALTCEAAVHQRFLISESELSIAAIGKLLGCHFPTLPPPATIELPNMCTLVLLTLFGHLGERVSYTYLRSNLGRRFHLENHKARRTLGIKFHRASEAIVSSVAEALGVVPAPPPSPVESTNSSLSTSSSYGSMGSVEGARQSTTTGHNTSITESSGLLRSTSTRLRSRSGDLRKHENNLWIPRAKWVLLAATVSLSVGFAAGSLASR